MATQQRPHRRLASESMDSTATDQFTVTRAAGYAAPAKSLQGVHSETALH